MSRRRHLRTPRRPALFALLLATAAAAGALGAGLWLDPPAPEPQVKGERRWDG